MLGASEQVLSAQCFLHVSILRAMRDLWKFTLWSECLLNYYSTGIDVLSM